MKGQSPLTDNHNSEEISVINIPNNRLVPGFHANQRCYKVHDRDSLKRTNTKIITMPFYGNYFHSRINRLIVLIYCV